MCWGWPGRRERQERRGGEEGQERTGRRRADGERAGFGSDERLQKTPHHRNPAGSRAVDIIGSWRPARHRRALRSLVARARPPISNRWRPPPTRRRLDLGGLEQKSVVQERFSFTDAFRTVRARASGRVFGKSSRSGAESEADCSPESSGTPEKRGPGVKSRDCHRSQEPPAHTQRELRAFTSAPTDRRRS